MTFKHEHYTLEHINKYTQMTKAEQANRHTDDFYIEKEGVQVDGLWLCKECANIVGELRKKAGWRDIKIGVNRDTRNWNAMLSDVVVYREGEPYAYGRIGHGDVGVSQYDYKYYVLSRKTRKARTGYGRWQNYVKASNDMKNVLRMVSQAFVPYAPMEISTLTVDDFTKTVRVERNLANGNLTTAWRDIINDNAGEELRQELMAMVKSGYQFLNHKITERITNYMAALETKQQAEAKRLDAYFVILHPEESTFIQYDNMGDSSKPTNCTKIKSDEIPFDLQMKMASLQVAAPMHYVEDLGMRVGETTFWVQR